MSNEARKLYSIYMDEITIGEKVYISSKRAAKITGYAKDYVGQLCREGRVEARLVGRNWYVLESAIREHRFGSEQNSKDSAVIIEEDVADDRSSTWQKPSYVAESPSMVPELAPKTAQEVVESPAIADMQSAWREWFSEKKPVEALPDGSGDFKDEYLPVVLENTQPAAVQEEEAVVLLQRIQTPTELTEDDIEEESEVEIHKSYESRETGEQIPHTSIPVVDLSQRNTTSNTNLKQVKGNNTSKNSTGSGVLKAVFVVVAVAAILIAVVGTGNAERFISGTSADFGIQRSVIDFLGGKSSYKSSL